MNMLSLDRNLDGGNWCNKCGAMLNGGRSARVSFTFSTTRTENTHIMDVCAACADGMSSVNYPKHTWFRLKRFVRRCINVLKNPSR